MSTSKLSTWKKLFAGRRPANTPPLNYMEVKELSEHMEQQRAAAKEAIRLYVKTRRTYETVCRAYLAQCQDNHPSKTRRSA